MSSQDTAGEMVAAAKGFLTMDESTTTCNERFEKVGTHNVDASSALCCRAGRYLHGAPARHNLPNLLLNPNLSKRVMAHQEYVRKVVCQAAKLGVSAPGLMVSLGYLDAYIAAPGCQPISSRPSATISEPTPMNGSMPRAHFIPNGRENENHADERPTRTDSFRHFWRSR